MRTSTGLACDHDEQQRKGLCFICDLYGETHDSCVDCSAELDDEDGTKQFIHEGPDGLRRCQPCHEDAERAYKRAQARDDAEAHYDGLFSEWKGGR